jgi:hypothetical protein
MAQQRIAGTVKLDIIGQHDRQLVGWDRDGAASLAMDDRDRTAPIALARHAPVAQPVNRCALALVLSLDPVNGGSLGRFNLKTVQKFRIIDLAGANIGLLVDGESRSR